MARMIFDWLSSVLLFQLQYSCGLLTGRSPEQRFLHRPKLSPELIDRFIVVPEHKLLFCYIDKVACSNFNRLFRTVRARYDPSQLEGDFWFRNSPEAHGLDLANLSGILADRSWHKAVFYRDPIERFVSAFASKCEGADRDGGLRCQDQFGVPTLPFADAVQQIDDYDHNRTEHHTFNEHFRLQSEFCGGLSGNFQYYDTIEKLDRNTAHAKVSELLEKVGVEPSSVSTLDDLFPKPQAERHYMHYTGASDDLSRYFPKGEKWRRSTLRNHFAKDYELFRRVRRGRRARAGAGK